MGIDPNAAHFHRSTYRAVPPGREGSSDTVEEPPAQGRARGRTLRITGYAASALLLSAAGASAWLGGVRPGRARASVRSRVGLEEHAECKPYEAHVDFRGLKELRRVERINDSRRCNQLCSEAKDCAAWTWGRLRNVGGFSDVCVLKELPPGGKAKKYGRYGTVAGLKPSTPCGGSFDRTPASVSGHIKSRDGFCLQAVAPVRAGSEVAMGRCRDGGFGQDWTYVEKTGEVKNKAGLCLNAADRSRPFVPLQMYPCDSGNWSQQWMFDADTGLIKSWRGACVDAAERNIEGGMVYTQTCHVGSANQRWKIGGSGNQPPLQLHRPGTLYCFALMLPGSYEQDLLKMQHRRGVSLFACDEYAVYSNRVIHVDDGVTTGVVSSDLKCKKGGEFGTALNLDIFIAVWTKVVSDARFEQHDWTVKVDPDAVFFPDRLRHILQIHPEAENGVFLNNCRFGMHGPVEVFSRNAVTAWAVGSPRCVQHFQKKCGGDCFWGEDLFVDQCLWKVLGVRRDNDFRVLLEDHCAPPKGWDSCTDSSRVAFHPFKSVDGYRKCLDDAGQTSPRRPLGTSIRGGGAPAPAAAPAPEHRAPAATARPAAAAERERSHAAAPEHRGSGSRSSRSDCHTAVSGERCYVAVKWAMDFGIRLHPDWYDDLTPESSWYRFQEALHSRPHIDCPMPCEEEEETA